MIGWNHVTIRIDTTSLLFLDCIGMFRRFSNAGLRADIAVHSLFTRFAIDGWAVVRGFFFDLGAMLGRFTGCSPHFVFS